MQIDFTVPIIDNYGDVGSALSLALSLTEKDTELTILFYSEDEELFEKMLEPAKKPDSTKIFEPTETLVLTETRIIYRPLQEYQKHSPSPVRCNFFAYPFGSTDGVKKVLNFDYLQFHSNAPASGPRGSISSLHNTRYTNDVGSEIVHIVPSISKEGGGVARFSSAKFDPEVSYIRAKGEPYIALCSVFVYPKTLELILSVAAEFESICFVSHHTLPDGVHLHNWHTIPFLTKRQHQELLKHCDLNIVRGEDSFVRALLVDKPFLWDIYRERNGVHTGKMQDFCEYLEVIGQQVTPQVAQITEREQLTEILKNFIDENPATQEAALRAMFEKIQNKKEALNRTPFVVPELIPDLTQFVLNEIHKIS